MSVSQGMDLVTHGMTLSNAKMQKRKNAKQQLKHQT